MCCKNKTENKTENKPEICVECHYFKGSNCYNQPLIVERNAIDIACENGKLKSEC